MAATETYFNDSALYISFLTEQDEASGEFAMTNLLPHLDYLWAEVHKHIEYVLSLYMSPTFPKKELAAYFLAKIYYHTEDLETAAEYILEAGEYFDITKRDGFVDTMLTKCVERYTSLRKEHYHNPEDLNKALNPKLETIVNNMFRHSLDTQKDLKICAGIAIECRRLDIVEEVTNKATNLSSV